MLNFKEWMISESKFMQLDKDQQDQIVKIAAEIGRVIIREDIPQTGKKIAEFERKDGRKPVQIWLTKPTVDGLDSKIAGNYFPYMNLMTINANSDTVWSRTGLIALLSHEMTHAIDPKLVKGGKYLSKVPVNYDFNKEKERSSYFKSPEEFDAYGTSIVTHIKAYPNKQEIISQLESFLRNNDDKLLKNLSSTEREAINYWKTKPTLWRKFQQRLFNLLQELKSEQIT
jgi:hypothetical protein